MSKPFNLRANVDSAWNWTANLTQNIASARNLSPAYQQVLTKLRNQLFPTTSRDMKGLHSGPNLITPQPTHGSASKVNQVPSTTTVVRSSWVKSVMSSNKVQVLIEKAIAGSSKISTESVRAFGNIFNYATSKWALGCIVTAVMLNRAYVYARTRRSPHLSWKIRLLLRIVPILLLVVQCRRLLHSIHCQTSTDYVNSHWGNEKMYSDLLLNQNGGFLHEISSRILFQASEKDSCLAVNMIPSEDNLETEKQSPDLDELPIEAKGSLSTLWPLFKTLSFSHIMEVISCAVLGQQIPVEYGLSFFELSLAFTEAEAVAVNKSDMRRLRTKISTKNLEENKTSSETNTHRTRSMILKNENTSPEVLLIGLITAMNHLTSHILAVLDQQARFRLLNTSIWGLAYIVSIMAGASSFSIDGDADQTLLRFPTIFIITFIPHILILNGIIGCLIIYVIALLLTALAPPIMEETGYRQNTSKWLIIQRILLAHNNMQANVSLSRIHVSLRTDFYTALVRTGFALKSMANEAVYLNESREVNIKRWTWLEDDRLQELEDAGLKLLGPESRLHYQNKSTIDRTSHDGLAAIEGQRKDEAYQQSNGYAREMVTQTSGTTARQRSGISSSGVGATERCGRWYMAFELCLGFSRLLLACYGNFHLWLMARLGIQFQPRWLLWMARLPKNNLKDAKPETDLDHNSTSNDLERLHGNPMLRKRKDVDIEVEFRKTAHRDLKTWTDANEKELDDHLYRWWLDGGWWGEKDGSGNFSPTEEERDDDAISVTSSTTTDDDQNWQNDSADEGGYRTPTQSSPLFSRESTPSDTTLMISNLVQLLDPKTPGQREEAESLAVHLSSDKIVTRSRFHELRQRSRTKVLTSTLQRPQNFVPSFPNGKLTLEEESHILEHLIITRRGLAINSSEKLRSTGWASEMGDGGPMCVICQTSPRCIIVWPCRCLSLCNDCRVTLAMNNFEKCVCCRGDVRSYSRIFAP